MEGRRDTHTYQQGMNTLALCLVLISCVVQVANCEPIYSPSPMWQDGQGVKDHAYLNLMSPEGSKMPEDAEYDENNEVITLRGLDGSFLVQDYEKGLQIMKDTETSSCYVVPVATDKTVGVKVEKFLKGYDGHEIQTSEPKDYRAIILPGAIEDTSFLPKEAEAECKEYRWMTIIGEEADMSECELEGQSNGAREIVTVSRQTIPLSSVASSRHTRGVEVEVVISIKIKFGPN